MKCHKTRTKTSSIIIHIVIIWVGGWVGLVEGIHLGFEVVKPGVHIGPEVGSGGVDVFNPGTLSSIILSIFIVESSLLHAHVPHHFHHLIPISTFFTLAFLGAITRELRSRAMYLTLLMKNLKNFTNPNLMNFLD
ncbi:hypothetical protein P8452_64036 [Trifolium repens]|jgi:hypothetical protein|nr:hypothetical protein QL285_075331 [Trifolium repens]KAK2449845.1 hypothetical protein QL285_009000 [Trifolium repens]WJX81114.1 hypothetical protein P8452_64036 [Trifolium repens]